MYTALSWNLMCVSNKKNNRYMVLILYINLILMAKVVYSFINKNDIKLQLILFQVISLILIISSVHSKPHNIKAFDTNYSKIDVKNKLRDLKDRNESQRLFKKSITPPTDQTPLVADVDKKSQIILQNPGLKTLQQLYYGTLSYQGFINIQPAQAQQQQTFIPILSPQIIVAPFAIPPNANFNPFIDSAQTPSLIHNSSSESEATKPVSVLPSSVKPVTQTTENNYYSSISTTLKPPTYTTVHPVQYHPIVNQFGTSSTTTTLKPLTYNPNLNIFATGNYPPQTTRPYYLPPNHAVYNFDIRKHTISNVTNISTGKPNLDK